MRFPYQQRHGRYLPIIPIRLKSVDGEWITFDAFVDSGASYSIFTAEIDEKTFNATVEFSKQLGIGFNIIGRKDIFERFKVRFNEKEKVVEFIDI